MFYSKISGKIKIIVNDILQVNTKRLRDNSGIYSLYVGTKTIQVRQDKKGEFDLKVGHVSFKIMMN